MIFIQLTKIKYSPFIILLFKELSRRNEKLQEDNDTKTSKIASLELRVEALEEAILAMQSLIQGLQ